jgi:hypothetical protein
MEQYRKKDFMGWKNVGGITLHAAAGQDANAGPSALLFRRHF